MGVRFVSGALSLVLVLLGSASSGPPPESLPPGGTYFDDDGNIHEPMIEAISAAGITRGCTEPDLYCPTAIVTRGQMAAFLNRALDLDSSDRDPFVDDDRSPFEADIAALAASGITSGCAQDRFCPEATVTRGQMAAFLTRAFDLRPTDGDPFVDDDGSPFEADIAALAESGITSGCGQFRFCPEAPVTRDQMASFLGRALELPPASPPPRPAATIAFTGDTLVHMQVSAAAARGSGYDFSPMFDAVRPLLASTDLALCHLEVPLSATSTDLSGYPTFNAPREVADGLASAGYDGCSTASNHSYDQGFTGVVETLNVLDDAGLGHAGTARSASEAESITSYELADLTVAHLSATWWLNGFVLPPDLGWLVEEPVDVERLIHLAERARADGADFVVVSVHCCAEYQMAPTAYQTQLGRSLVDSDSIDLVVGHHAHVVQPIEYRNGEYIVYGLGNFLSAQRRLPETIDGVVVVADVALRGDAWVTRSIGYLPTRVDPDGYRIALAHGASWTRTSGAIERFGAPNVEPIAGP